MPMSGCHALHGRMLGCLVGSAVGDALGGPVEGMHFSDIIAKNGFVNRMLPYPDSLPPSFHGPFGTRAGEYTDDTRLAKLLCSAFIRCGGSPREGDVNKVLCEAYSAADSVLERGFLEEYALKAWYGRDKEAFGGKTTNGAIMAIAPVGLLFPGDPVRTFDTAFTILSMATGSARISAATAAACISLALTGTGRPVDLVMQGLRIAEQRLHRTESSYWHYGRMYPRVGGWCLGLAKKALDIASDCEHPLSVEFFGRLQAATSQPFFADGDETLAIALAMFVAAGGDFRSSVLGAVNYGKDCDSYAAVAGALAGAFCGIEAVPDEWIASVEEYEAPPRLRDLADGLCATVVARMRREERAAASVAPVGHPAPTVPASSDPAGSDLAGAVRACDEGAVRGLLERGADPDTRVETGRTCLHLACAAGHIGIVRLLLIFGADIDAKDGNRTTALHFAAWENHADCVRLLLDQGIFPEETEGSGWTALHDAVRREYADIPPLILSKSRGLRNVPERTAALENLHGEDRFLALLELLSEHFIDLGAIGICGHGLVHDAKKRAYPRALAYLLGKGVTDED